MANHFRRVFQTKSREYIKFTVQCFGSNSKARSCASFFGFSASIAAFGYGIKTCENVEATRPKFLKIPRISRSKREEDRTPFFLKACQRRICVPRKSLAIQQRSWRGDNFSKIFNLLLPLLTPVSCEQNQDPFCDDDVDTDSTANESKETETNNVNNTRFDSSKSESSNPPPPRISNKPCRKLGREGTCGKPPGDIDLDAISKQLGGVEQITWAPESDLSHCNLIRQACQVAVDSVTRIVTEAGSAYEDYHAEYREIIDSLIDTLEDSRKACGTDLEVIECKLVLIRAKADEMKRRIRDLDMLIGTLEKLANSTAEAAFMAHAEYASVAMSERLNSLLTQVRRLREESREKERDMLELQSLIIVETGKSLK